MEDKQPREHMTASSAVRQEMIRCTDKLLFWTVNTLFLVFHGIIAIYTDTTLSMDRSFWEGYPVLFRFMSVYFKTAAIIYLFVMLICRPYRKLFNYTLIVKYGENKITLIRKNRIREIYYSDIAEVRCIPKSRRKWGSRYSPSYIYGFVLKIKFNSGRKIYLYTPHDEYHGIFEISGLYNVMCALGGKQKNCFGVHTEDSAVQTADKPAEVSVLECKRVYKKVNKVFLAVMTCAAVIMLIPLGECFDSLKARLILLGVGCSIFMSGAMLFMVRPYIAFSLYSGIMTLNFTAEGFTVKREDREKSQKYLYSNIKNAFLFEKENAYKDRPNPICIRINLIDGNCKDIVVGLTGIPDSYDNENLLVRIINMNTNMRI